jgi:hypothetical protein
MFEKYYKNFSKIDKRSFEKILKKLTKLFGLLEPSQGHRHPT